MKTAASVAVVLALAGCGGGGESGSQGTLAVGRGRDVFALAPDGSGERRLVANAGEPAWSPDGEELAFTRVTRPPKLRIDVYVVRRDGGEARLLVRNAAAPAWSPDGERIAFMRDRCFFRDCPELENPYELYVVGADGRGIRRLTRNTRYDGEPAWSPDGKRIAFATDDGVFLMNADGTGSRRLTRGGYHQNPAWSPNGRTVLYDTFVDIFSVDVATRRVRRLSRNSGPDRGAAWSPDGRRVAYLSEAVCRRCFSAEDPLELWVMGADGNGARRLGTTRGFTSVDWGRS